MFFLLFFCLSIIHVYFLISEMYDNKFGYIHFIYILSDYLTAYHVLNIS